MTHDDAKTSLLPQQQKDVKSGETPPAYSAAGAAPVSYAVVMVPAVVFTCCVCGYAGPNAISGNLMGKCGSCSEVTLLGNPPPDKQYHRCRCNCLLKFPTGSAVIQCVRPNCKAVIQFQPLLSSKLHVQCLSCSKLLSVPESCGSPASQIVCPGCSSKQYSSKSAASSRGIVFLIVGLIFIAVGVGVTVGTYSAASGGGMYVVYYGPMVVGAIEVLYSMYLFCGTFPSATPYVQTLTSRNSGGPLRM